MSTDTRDETERELRRVVDRLTTMPIGRTQAAQPAVQACADVLVAEGRRLGVPIPADASPGTPGPSGMGPMIAVLGGDCLRTADDDDLGTVLEALVTLRRALP